MQFLKTRKTKLQKHFLREGFVNLGKLFELSEVELMKNVINNCEEMQKQKKNVKNKYENGKYPSFETIFVMNDVFSDNIFSLACRRPEIIDFISESFDDDAYLYHSKVPLKYPGMPGFKYHQDYFYWYKMGCLFPNMATCFIALETTTLKNGCLKFIPKSHLCGRLEHIEHDGFSDSETDPERVKILKRRFGEVEILLNPGEVTIFHANLLHSSEPNNSDLSRLALLGCFNTASNSPINDTFDHPPYKPQKRFKGKIDEELIHSMPDFNISFARNM